MQAVQRGAAERLEAADVSQRLQSDVRLIEQSSLRHVRVIAEKERALGSLQNKVGDLLSLIYKVSPLHQRMYGPAGPDQLLALIVPLPAQG